MLISKLQEYLEEVKKQYGDVDVFLPAGNGPFDNGEETIIRPRVAVDDETGYTCVIL